MVDCTMEDAITTSASSSPVIPAVATVSLGSVTDEGGDDDDSSGKTLLQEQQPDLALTESCSSSPDSSLFSDRHRHIYDMANEDKYSVCVSPMSLYDDRSLHSLDVSASIDSDVMQHSEASAVTVKSPSSGRVPWPEERGGAAGHAHQSLPLEQEDEVPVQQSCHSALAITPKQLADVFSYFASESPTDTKPASSGYVITTSKPLDCIKPNTGSWDSPEDVSPPQLTKPVSPSDWEPRAKSLEQECATLKAIIRVDSSNIMRLKSALESFRDTTTCHVREIQSLRDQLASQTKGAEVLRRENDEFKEHEVEYKETIKILKHEVDILTQQPPPEEVAPVDHNTERLLMENKLFASQVVDCEVELNRCRSSYSQLEQENAKLRKQLEEPQSKDRKNKRSRRDSKPAGPVKDWRQVWAQQGSGVQEVLMDEEVDDGILDNADMDGISILHEAPKSENENKAGNKNGTIRYLPSSQKLQPPEKCAVPLATSSLDVASFAPLVPLVGQLATIEESKESSSEDDELGESAVSCATAKHEPVQNQGEKQDGGWGAPIINTSVFFGQVFGMCMVGSMEEEKESEPSSHEKNPSSCVAWRSPEVNANTAALEAVERQYSEPEERNPSTSLSFEETGITDEEYVANSLRNVWDEMDRMAAEEDIDIIEDTFSDSEEAIEVQLSHSKMKIDRSNDDACSETCFDKCDAWNVFSDCLSPTE